MLGKCVGNYVIEAPLGRGGMGEVFLARHPKLERRAAIKFFNASINPNPELAARFFDEARLTASLKHPNVVDIFDFGEVDGRLYYLMELLSGSDLAVELDRRGALSLELGLEFLRQICLGLAEVHRAGIVHRDLKPSNIFVLEGEPHHLKITDFGIAKNTAVSSRGTSYGQILGTPTYMSPEQALGEVHRVSPQSDLYSLGIIAHELLTGEPAFTLESPVALLIAHVQTPAPSLATCLPGAPPELTRIIDACLEKDPQQRPESAQHLVACFTRLLADLKSGSIANLGAKLSPTLTVPTGSELRHLIAIDDTLPGRALPPSTGQPFLTTMPAIRIVELGAAPPPAERPGLSPTDPAPPDEPSPLVSEPRPSSIAPRSVERSHAENDRPVSLSKDDRDIFTKLLAKMQRRGDMPAFVASVGDVSSKADFEGRYSATQLAEAILKDYALTARLLRTVNTLYATRFGVRIRTVQHAIVILGFERVRSIALSISVFNKTVAGENAARATDSAVHALVSGEVSRELAEMTGLVDPEQAMICSMFRNLGRHLLVVYLPEAYAEVVKVAQQRDMTEDASAASLLGISLRKIGLGVAEQWKLPDRIGKSMAHQTDRRAGVNVHSRPAVEAQLGAFSQISNELSDLVALGVADAKDSQIHALLERHRDLVQLSPEEIGLLLERVQAGFRKHYGAMFGKRIESSQFLVNLRALTPTPSQPEAVQTAEVNKRVLTQAAKAPPGVENRAMRQAGVRVEKLKLGGVAPEPSLPAEDPIARHVLDLTQRFERDPGGRQKHLEKCLEVCRDLLKLPRLFLLVVNDNRGTLGVTAGLGNEAESIAPHLRVELQRGSLDVFSKAYYLKRDFIVKDSFTKNKSHPIPPIYFELLGAPAFALFACQGKSGGGRSGDEGVALLLCDVEDPLLLPSEEVRSRFHPLRHLLARAI